MADQLCICLCVVGGSYVVMCCDVRIDAGTKCWSSGKGDYHVGHVTGGTINTCLVLSSTSDN